MKHTDLIQGLRDDIEAMRLQILRLNNQILRNEVVLKEIEIHERYKPDDAIILNDAIIPTIPAMVNQVLDSLPLVFKYQDVIELCQNRWPNEDPRKIRIGVYPAIIGLKKKGHIIGDGNGGMMIKGKE